MKTYFLIAALLVISLVYGQDPRVGVSAGFVISNARVKYATAQEELSQTPKPGTKWGIFFHFDAGKNLVIRPALEIVSKGFNNQDRYGRRTVGVGYVDLPLNVLYATKLKSQKLYLGGGPVLGIFLNSNYDLYNVLSKFDYGLNTMITYETPIGFSLSINHTHGFKNVSVRKDIYTLFKNRHTAITIGYLF